jgi:hypothetical protein
MPTPITHNPFAPPASPGPEQLAAYVQGRLTEAEQHAVERALEADPLLRDAVDGLREPGAVEAMRSLHHLRPKRGGASSLGPWVAGIVVIGLVGILLWPEEAPTPTPLAELATAPVPEPPMNLGSTPIAVEELESAVELPVAEQIGRPQPKQATDEDHTAPVDRSTDVEPLADRRPDPSTIARPEAPRPLRGSPRSSVQLIYLHDLKLVHPKELYAKDLLLTVPPGGVDASHADSRTQQQYQRGVRNLAYTTFMDQAMARFARADDRGCLEELNFLLTQYPDDPNALFYAGQCTYNLGLYERARHYLHRAATHPIDVFHEEATWYHALTLERLGDRTAAREAFGRIVAQGGFYAERAGEKLVAP